MSVPRPPRKRPTSVDEIGRVLRIYDLLADEIVTRRRHILERGLILTTAERIAARTED